MGAAFSAADAVVKLDWNFRPFVDANGTVPEPTTDQVGAFFDDLRVILDRPEDDTDQNVVQFMGQMSRDQKLFADPKLLAAHAALCSDQPTAEQLAGLPHRHRQAFFGWVIGQVTDPT
jgi:hypothetical protein